MWLQALQFYFPAALKKKKILELFALTAEAFGCESPAVQGLSFRGCLLQYALFTREQADKAIQRGDDLEALRGRLYQNAFRLGQKLRKTLNIVAPADVITASRLIYQVLGIDYAGNCRGEVIIGRCYFSRFYSGEVCRVISALDEGLAAGLSGGGRLFFKQRITEGHQSCLAYFEIKG